MADNICNTEENRILDDSLPTTALAITIAKIAIPLPNTQIGSVSSSATTGGSSTAKVICCEMLSGLLSGIPTPIRMVTATTAIGRAYSQPRR